MSTRPATAPFHPCGSPLCHQLAEAGERYCEKCRAERWQRDRARRGTSSRRGYSGEWRRRRLRVLKRDHYLCLYCLNIDRDTEATIVDHVFCKEAGGTDDESNLASCCRRCHDQKTICHDGGYGRQLNPIRTVKEFVPTWEDRAA